MKWLLVADQFSGKFSGTPLPPYFELPVSSFLTLERQQKNRETNSMEVSPAGWTVKCSQMLVFESQGCLWVAGRLGVRRRQDVEMEGQWPGR